MPDTLVMRLVKPGAAPSRTERPCLVQIYGPSLGRKFTLEGGDTSIGRDETCGIQVDIETVSHHHCRLIERDGNVYLTDEGSTNGTWLNGVEIGQEAPLRSGDLIKVGSAIFKYLAGDEQGAIEAQYHEEIYRLTIIDGLTQLYNKRYALDFLERELARASRHTRALSLVIFDVDHFKAVNDARGHSAGDAVLRELSGLLRKRVRREECLARWGGEEFALVLPESDEGQARFVAEALRRLVAEHPFCAEEPLRVTLSAGVASYRETYRGPDGIIEAADRALYEAKHRGRNQVVAAGS
jgi:two-component system, cell cycle response regulator